MFVARHRSRVFLVALAAMLAASLVWAATPEAGSDITVRVDIQGDFIYVDAELVVPASAREVWAVLTDFDQLPRFVSNIASSRVLSREGNVVRVAQTGKAGFGPLSFEFQSERELTLTPFEKLESRMLSGNMRLFRGTTRLEPADGATRLRYHSEAVPQFPIQGSLGRSLIESETREHYGDIRREVLRRKALAGGR
jgi:ribosome-associated toxin RatA of RatAB toxin-antitoxin module